ncbi:MAG: HEPN domain-containing protein [Anaerolineales bacterium]|nr:MAG: HEPN domain-containing protein [Anaerolineales bacterium]
MERVKAYGTLRHLTEQEKKALAEYLRHLKEEYGDTVVRVVLYGSKVRGDCDEESDLDLLTVMGSDDPRLLEAVRQISFPLKLDYGVALSDLVVGASRYDWMRSHEEPLFRNIRDEGVELWPDYQPAADECPQPRRNSKSWEEQVDENTKLIIGIRLERCKEDLKFARLLLKEGGYRQSISRAYYAVFMITTAALLVFDIRHSKHSAVESAVHQHLVKPGLIEPEYGRIYSQAFKHRLEADYKDEAQFNEEKARHILDDAERFVARLEKYLRSMEAIE